MNVQKYNSKNPKNKTSKINFFSPFLKYFLSSGCIKNQYVVITFPFDTHCSLMKGTKYRNDYKALLLHQTIIMVYFLFYKLLRLRAPRFDSTTTTI